MEDIMSFLKVFYYQLEGRIWLIALAVIGSIILFMLRGKISKLILKPLTKNLTETEKITVERFTKLLVTIFVLAIDITLIVSIIGHNYVIQTLLVPFLALISKQLLAVCIILAVTTIFYGLRKKIINKLLSFSTKATESKKATLEQVLSRILGIVIIGLGIIQLLILFGTDTATIITFTGALSVAFGLAAKDLVNDFLSGTIFIIEDQFHLGDVITVEDISGEVVDINLRTLVLRSADGNLHSIPNGNIQIITNHTRDFSKATVVFGVSYNCDIDFVIDVLNDEMAIALTELDMIKEVPVVHGIIDFGDSAIKMRVVATCVAGEHWQIERELRRRIKIRFDKENIEMPFPQRVVTLNKED